MKKKNKKKPGEGLKIKKWQIGLAVFFVVILILIIFSAIYYQSNSNKFYPGLKITGVEVGGKTMAEAQKILQNKLNKFNEHGLAFVYQDYDANILPIINPAETPEYSFVLYEFHLEETLQKAFNFGRTDTAFNNLKRWMRALFQQKNFNLDYSLDQEKLKIIIQNEFQFLEKPAQNAQLDINDTEIKIISEKQGLVFDYSQAIKTAIASLAQLQQQPIALIMKTDLPTITRTQAEENIEWLEETLSLAPITLQYKDSSWILEQDELADYLDLHINDDPTVYEKGRIIPGLDNDNFKEYLESIAEEIDIEPKEAKFEIKNGRVTQFQASGNGLELAIDDNYQKIKKEIIFDKHNEIDLIVNTVQSQTKTSDANTMGINELIGYGSSNFAGSPANRRHNIAVGAATLNGLIIKPDKEFSLIKTLGEIDAEHGYKAELVIKGDRTIPEFGGGLCQIGTTTFRVALNAGLPIIERKNHSYRVSYYEPAGTDATIYDPKPDMRFFNDTGNNILFITKIHGDELIFEFWGTDDGRKVEQFPDPPKIWGIKAPPPTKIVETTDLPVGQKKCTERAHNGATTEFTYQVTYPNGEVETEIFESVYTPWQAVCLLGVEELSEDEDGDSDSDQPEIEDSETSDDDGQPKTDSLKESDDDQAKTDGPETSETSDSEATGETDEPEI